MSQAHAVAPSVSVRHQTDGSAEEARFRPDGCDPPTWSLPQAGEGNFTQDLTRSEDSANGRSMPCQQEPIPGRSVMSGTGRVHLAESRRRTPHPRVTSTSDPRRGAPPKTRMAPLPLADSGLPAPAPTWLDRPAIRWPSAHPPRAMRLAGRGAAARRAASGHVPDRPRNQGAAHATKGCPCSSRSCGRGRR